MTDPAGPAEPVVPGDGGRPLVSIVIPTRNEASTIERAITTLLDSPVDADVEVIVADGASEDGTADVVRALGRRDPRIRVVDNPARTTPNGLNAAILATRGDVILRMDGHAEAEPGYVAACLDVLRTSDAWNVGGLMRKVGTSVAARAASAATSSAFGIGGGRRFHLLTEPADVDSVWLGCWPRWVFARVGLFDPEMVVNQDEELNRRILDAGGRIRLDPSISAAYLSRASWRGLARQYFRYGMYKVRNIQKHPNVFRLRHFIPAALVASVVVPLVVAIWLPPAALVSVAVLAAWLVGASWFARRVAVRHEAPVPAVVAAYAVLHAAYGSGTWVGLVRFAPRWIVRRAGSVPRLGTAG